MCQGLGPKKHDETSEIDRTVYAIERETDRDTHIGTHHHAKTVIHFNTVYIYIYV